jgi:hypothetical protein
MSILLAFSPLPPLPSAASMRVAMHLLVVAATSSCWLALKLPRIALSHRAMAIFSFSFLAIVKLDSAGAKFSITAPSHSNSSRS